MSIFPYEIFFDLDGQPLDGGYIYIGEANQNPITHPIAVSWDETGLYPAAQPIRTIGGYADRNGSAGNIYPNSPNFSLLIKNKSDEIIFNEQLAKTFSDVALDLAGLMALDHPDVDGFSVHLSGRTTYADGGEGYFIWDSFDNSANVTNDPLHGIYVPPNSDSSGASGCWKRISFNYYIAEWFNATSDYAEAIQGCNDFLVTQGFKATIYTSPGTKLCQSEITLNLTYVDLISDSLYDFSSLITGPAITVTCTELVSNIKYWAGKISGLRMLGPGNASAVPALHYEGSAGGIVAAIKVDSFGISEFGTGITLGSNAFGVYHTNGNIQRCATGYYAPTGLTNAGENMAFSHVIFSACNKEIDIDHKNGTHFFNNCSFDYPNGTDPFFVRINGGVANFNDCHFEGNNASTPFGASPIFYQGSDDSANLVIRGGVILGNQDPGGTLPYVFQNSANADRNAITIDGTYIFNMSTTTGYLASGAINAVNIKMLQGSGNSHVPPFTSDQNNLFIDGGFEGSSPVDVAINSDTSAIIDRLTGANIVLSASTDYAHTGTKSLKMVKAFGGGSNAGFIAYAPINTGAFTIMQFWYKKAGSQTGTIYAEFSYAKIDRFNQYGSPVVTKTQVIITRQIDFTAAAVDWTLSVSSIALKRAPSWANYTIVKFNCFGVGAGNLYFDDFLTTEYK